MLTKKETQKIIEQYGYDGAKIYMQAFNDGLDEYDSLMGHKKQKYWRRASQEKQKTPPAPILHTHLKSPRQLAGMFDLLCETIQPFIDTIPEFTTYIDFENYVEAQTHTLERKNIAMAITALIHPTRARYNRPDLRDFAGKYLENNRDSQLLYDAMKKYDDAYLSAETEYYIG